MIQKVLVTPIIGLPQINGWAQVTQSSDGQFICVFSIYGSQAGNVGRDVVDLIKNNSPTTPTAVYALMKKVVRFVNEKDCNIEISSSFFGDSATIFSAYNGSLLLKRNGKIGKILKADGDIKVIEGKKFSEDIFVLLTNTALEFKEEIFQKLSQGLDADTTVASIVPGVQNLENSSLVSMAFLSDLPNGYDVTEDTDLTSINGDTNRFNQLNNDKEALVIEFKEEKEKNDREISEKEPLFEAQTGKKKIKFDKKKLLGLVTIILVFLKKVIRLIFILIKRIFRFFKQLFTNQVYVDDKAKITKKRMRIIVLIILLILLITIPLIIFKLRINAQIKEAQREISPLLTEFEQVKSKVEENPIESREKISEIINDIEAKEKAFTKKKSGQKYISDQLVSVQAYFDSISGKEVFNELDVFFDFQLVESGFIANLVKLVGNTAYFFDKDTSKFIKLELGSKKVEVIDLGDQKNVSDFEVIDEKIYFLGEGILEKNLANDEITKIIDQGKSNQGAKLISLFNDNIYVLNQEQRNIYKYSYDSQAKEYSDPIRWIKSAKDLEFDQIVSMAVDGDIWLSTKLGQVFKLRGGEGSLFTINGLVEPLSDQTYLFTQPDDKNIYLLEPSSSRLIVVSKDGDFVKEVKSASLASASGLVVSESLNKAVVISGSLVFEVGL